MFSNKNVLTGLLIGAKKCRKAQGSYFVQGDMRLVNNEDKLKLIILIGRSQNKEVVKLQSFNF